MRAVQIADLGGPDSLRPADVPEPGGGHMLASDGGVVIDVRAAAVSFPDVLQSRGLYQYKPDMPFVPGAEVAGVVHERHVWLDRKSTRLNSSHVEISYAVFCLKKKKLKPLCLNTI